MGTNGERRTNKRWPETLKREIVAATFVPGASVSVVARHYDVNANQVFSWRRRYSDAGELSPSSSSSAPATPGLVPVTIAPEPEAMAATPPVPGASETIEIEAFGVYRIRVGSGFDCRALKHVLDVLRKR